MEDLYREVSESKLPTVSGISEKDVHLIWECVSNFIEKQMTLQKGVHINGLGTFSFSQQNLDAGNKASISRPVFVFSERLISSLGLTCTKPYTPGNIHTVNMNYTTIAFETNFSRDVAENCVKELLSAFYRAISDDKNVDLIFLKIGRLSVRGRKCKMKFYKQFIDLFDKSGSLLQAMQNRFDTPDSVVTDRSQVKSSQVVLPYSLKLGESPCQVNPVLEEKPEENVEEPLPQEPHVTDEGLDDNPFIPSLDINKINNASDIPLAENSPVHNPPGELTPVADAITNVIIENVLRTNSERDTSPEILVTGQNIINPDVLRKNDEVQNFSSRSVCSSEIFTKPRYEKSNSATFINRLPVLGKAFSAGALNRTRRCSYQQSHTARGQPVVQACCDHHSSGQEICYLCHQRQQRNIYMPFSEEKACRDKEEELLLQKYCTMKNTEHLLTEKEKKAQLKRELQDIQKSNFEVAEMKHSRKKERDINFVQSYLFQHRPQTPPLFTKMVPYSKELQKQIEIKYLTCLKEQEKENTEGQTEQINLASSLTKQREEYFKERAKKMNMYKTYLDKQVQEKTAKSYQQQFGGSEEEDTAREEEKEEDEAGYFGKNDVTVEMLAEKKRRANEAMQEQFKMLAQQKREEILKKMKEQQEDEKILRRNRADLLNDRALKCQRNYELHKELESDWKHRAMMKQQNLKKAKEKFQQVDMLVQDQCNRYHRCQQCKRCLWNRGSGNIWADTYFLPGTRYFI